jgi:hypothetical protein
VVDQELREDKTTRSFSTTCPITRKRSNLQPMIVSDAEVLVAFLREWADAAIRCRGLWKKRRHTSSGTPHSNSAPWIPYRAFISTESQDSSEKFGLAKQKRRKVEERGCCDVGPLVCGSRIVDNQSTVAKLIYK